MLAYIHPDDVFGNNPSPYANISAGDKQSGIDANLEEYRKSVEEVNNGKLFGLTKKPKVQSKEPVLYFDLKVGSSCDYHRVTLPLKEYEAKFHPKSDIFVFNRLFSGGLERMKQLKKEGIKIILDWDDFIELDSEHYLYDNFKSRGFTEMALDFIKLADVITVTTELLAYKLRPYHKNIVVIRNSLPFDQLQFTLSQDKSSSTPIIWAGGASHARDLSLMSGSFESSLITLAGYEDIEKVQRDAPRDLCKRMAKD